jgi:hypothetical protein
VARYTSSPSVRPPSVSACAQTWRARGRNSRGTMTAAVAVNSQLAGTGKASAGHSCSLKYHATAAAETSSQARKHCQFGKAPMTTRVNQSPPRSSRWPQGRRLTVKLRGRTTTPDKRRGRTLSPGARGANQTTPHGPLERLLGGSKQVPIREQHINHDRYDNEAKDHHCANESAQKLGSRVRSTSPENYGLQNA